MKHTLFSILVCLPLHVLSQSTGQNYVMTERMLDASGESRITSVQYCDGLGRPDILATDGLNTDGKTAYRLTVYDYSGLVSESWQPAVEGNSLDWRNPQAIKSLAVTTSGDEMPYSTFRRDVLDREVSVCRQGKKWHSAQKDVHTMRYANRSTGNPDRQAKRYVVSPDGESLSENGVWAEGSLAIESTSDEDGNTVMLFTDFLGQKILERRISDVYNDTYYIYNDYGQLRFVLSPMYQEEADLEKFAYEYRYDSRSRCIYKRIPGCQPVRYWYDGRNLPVFVQDGELREKGRCRFMFYDTMGRLAVSGTCCNVPENCQQATVTHKDSKGICGTGYQSVGGIVLSSPEIEVANYYDNYNFLADSAFSNNMRLSEMRRANYNNATGLQTGSIVRATSGELLCSVCYYTERGLPCDSRQCLPDGKLLLTRTVYSFTDKAVRTVYELRQQGRTDSVVTENTYSRHNDALLSTTVACNGGPARQVAHLKYDELGRMVKNTLPGGCSSIEYGYGVRDEITSIRGRHYSETVSYDGLYNGNIAGIENCYAGDAATNAFTFTYDKLNRMAKAVSSGSNGYMEEAGYDRNGNITRLLRRGRHNDGTYRLTDALVYSYDGNQVRKITDSAGQLVYDGSFDFKGSGSSEVYRFNANGALVYDPDKGITIDYSDTGSPIKIAFDTGNTTEYVYTADGKKLKTIWRSCQAQCREVSFEDDEDGYDVHGSGGGSQGVAAGGSVTNSREYAGPFIIDDGSVSRFLFDGGYCTLDGNGTAYHFYIKDHLGSNRVVMSETGMVEQKNYYYPFGGVYGDISTGYDVQGFKFNGKELDGRHGLTLYDYGARMYDPAIARWTSVDPLCEKYYSISPYAYCADNPVKFIDQDGKETHVAMNTNGTYSIIGGVLNKDRNIYLYSRDCYGYYSIRRGSIGITSSTTSFYNSDFNGGQGAWMIGAIIDPMDNSGKIFLNIMASMDITLDDYIDKARNGHPYDFKVTNGSENVISKTPNFIYRGMSIGTTVFGQTIYSSARDIGNMAAGIVAAKNGLPWLFARIAFDAYQSRHGFQHEGISTTNAEYYGWSQMYSRSNGMIEATNLRKSINSVLGKIWNLLFK